MMGRMRSLMTTRLLAVLAFLSALGSAVSAQLASRPVEDWVKVLESPERIAGLKIDDVIGHLKLTPGNVIADLGAGSGPFEVPFAKAVGPTGKVYAVDIDRNFFPLIESKTKAAGVTNVITVLGGFADPQLPTSDVDVAFLHDVVHHIDDRAAYLKNVSKYLKPTARVAIIEFNPEHSPHKDQPALQVSREQAAAWLAAVGFKPVTDIKLFADKWFVVYEKS
jgi:ubiquinone/menaquinone biosynthesis C-methylase UbiE